MKAGFQRTYAALAVCALVGAATARAQAPQGTREAPASGGPAAGGPPGEQAPHDAAERAARHPEDPEQPHAQARRPTERYEAALVAWGLAELGLTPEPAPEGKRIDAVHVAREDVVAESDPYPRWVNRFHWRTREHVVRREVRLQPGDAWDAARVAEAERNLRRLAGFAVVRAVPVRGRTPDTVGLLVVTKDLWSLRFNTEFSVVGTLVQSARVQPAERNVLGLQKRLNLDLLYQPDALAVGQGYGDRQFLGRRLTLAQSAFVLVDRETGQVRGSRGGFALGRPLASLSETEGWQLRGSWRRQDLRVFRAGRPWLLPVPGGGEVEYAYGVREVSLTAERLGARGQAWRTEWAWGAGAHLRRYAPEADVLPEAARYLRARWLPATEDAAYLSATVRRLWAVDTVLRDVDTYALSEDLVEGPLAELSVRAGPSWRVPGERGFVAAGARMRWARAWGGGYSRLSAAGALRRGLGPDAGGPGGRRWALEAFQASPYVLGGRFVGRALVDVDVDDRVQRVQLLGGGDGLRGAAADAYAGKRLVLANLEYRTPPLVVKTVHVGGVLFWDAGRAFDGGLPGLTHSVGLGVRVLFPQFNVAPFRFDVGYVLNAERPGWGGRWSGSSGQVSEVRPDFLSEPLR